MYKRKIPTPLLILFCAIVFVLIIILFEGSLKGIFSASGVVGAITILTKMF